MKARLNSIIILMFALCGVTGVGWAEISNNRSSISLEWIGKEGEDYKEEYFYHDRSVWDFKTVYIKDTTPISMSIKKDSKYPNGKIRYRVDRDLNYDVNWHSSVHHPVYSTPFSFSSLRYEDGSKVVGTTGPKPGIELTESTKNFYYYRGSLDIFGGEWHSISVANDISEYSSDKEYNVVDGKFFVFLVNPQAPCFTVETTGEAQFYTTPPKHYFLPKIFDQVTYVYDKKGGVTISLTELNGKNVVYRINGGTVVQTGKTQVSISSSLFKEGENVLEFYSEGQEEAKRVRKIIKNPDFPSKNEKHGKLLWGNTKLYENFQNNISKPGEIKQQWEKFLKETPGQLPTVSERKAVPALPFALIANVKGVDYKKTASSLTYSELGKKAILSNLFRVDPIGLELNQNGDSIPSREIKDRGYYTVGSRERVLDIPFAYDLLISSYRSDNHPSGITPIEDFYIRDLMARWVMFTMTEIGGYHKHTPGMWGRCRFIASQVISLAMPTYSTHYFGTSGVDGNTTVYKDVPFPNQGYTWKTVFIDESHPTPGYPDPKFKADFDAQWIGKGNGEVEEGGVWGDRLSYVGQRLCGWPYGTLAMMSKLHTGKDYPALFKGIERLKAGKLMGSKKLSSENESAYGPAYAAFPFVDNYLFWENVNQHWSWAQETGKIGDYYKYGNPYTFIWFDPEYVLNQSMEPPRQLRIKK